VRRAFEERAGIKGEPVAGNISKQSADRRLFVQAVRLQGGMDDLKQGWTTVEG